MTLTVNRPAILPALAAAAKIARGVREIRMQAIKNVLTIEATDMEHWVAFTLPAKGRLEPVQIDGQRLHDVMASLLEDEAKLELKDGALKIQCGKGRRTMATVSQEWPSVEFEPDVTVAFEAKRLIEALAFCAPHVAAPSDIAKAFISGVRLYAEKGKARAMGADGMQIALFEIGPCEEAFAATLSPTCVDLVSRMAAEQEQIEIGVNGRATEFRWSDGIVRGPRIEGDYPIALANKAAEMERADSFEIDTKELLATIRSVRALGTEDRMTKSACIKLVLDKAGSRMSAISAMGEAEQEIGVNYAGPGWTGGFAAARMERMLASFGDAVLNVQVGDHNTPMRLDAAGLEDRFGLLFGLRV